MLDRVGDVYEAISTNQLRIPGHLNMRHPTRLLRDSERASHVDRSSWKRLEDGSLVRVTTDRGSDLQPVWSPDGRRLAYGSGTMTERRLSIAAARILARNHGYRYYDWTLTDGTFQFVEHPVNLAHEKALEGTYLIQTEEPHLSPVDAVTVYKELSEVERAFAELKDVIADVQNDGSRIFWQDTVSEVP